MGVALVWLASFSVVSNGQELPSSALKTGGSWNGDSWLHADASMRIAYINGMLDGVRDACLYNQLRTHAPDAEYRKCLQYFWVANVSVFDLMDQVAHLYSNPANRAIPLDQIYVIAVGIMQGTPEEKTNANLEYFRRVFTQSK